MHLLQRILTPQHQARWVTIMGCQSYLNAMTDTPLPTETVTPNVEFTADATHTPEHAAGIKMLRTAQRQATAQPVLEKLFELYPHLFGAEFVPLKLGIFQELMAAHPDAWQRDALKQALGVHTRSTRYLQCMAAGKKRHDLTGTAVEDVAPEHVYGALLEVFRRRQLRSKEDLTPKLRTRLIAAFEASGLSRQDYLARVHTQDAAANALIDQALALHGEKQAKDAALLRAFDSSGATPAMFADMYGMPLRDVTAALARRV